MATSASLFARPRSLHRALDTPRWWRRIDLVMLGAAMAIALSGVLMIYSATRYSGTATAYTGLALRQLAALGLGVLLLAGVASFDYRRLRASSPWIYGGGLLVLLAVLSPLGSASKGAQAWFQFGSMQLQPSELAKVALVVCLAAYCARQRTGIGNRHVGFVVAMAALPMGLILLQPDLGTVLVFVAITFAVLLVAGASGRSIAALVVLAIALAIAAFSFGMLKQYQLDRLGAFLDPGRDTAHAAYNLNQSKIAIGSGGLDGKGLFHGTQTNLQYVPEQHTDFIFTVVGEELGLLGGATLLALYAIVLWRIWLAARDSADRFGTLICAGVMAMFVFQIFENIGMTMGIMPITGIPLPLVSYGGSSMLASCLALGLVLNVRFRGHS